MKKIFLLTGILLAAVTFLSAQEEETEKKGFKKENLFTGGGVSFGLGFSSGGNTFSIGASPVFGYSITNWLDAGIVANYNYASYRYPFYDYKVRISEYGGGVFAKIYPIRFLFLQAQYEHNFGRQKGIYDDGTPPDFVNYDGNSFLVGAGYATSRDPQNKMPFFYISLMADVSGNKTSPYVNAEGNAVPLIRAGVQIPLFQGKRDRYDDDEGGSRRPRNYNR